MSRSIKTLILMRHAKSDWGNENLPDIDRPLNARGVKDAARMGKELKQRGLVPDLILCSPALRTRQTAEGLTGAEGLSGVPVQIIESLYGAAPRTLLSALQSAPENCECVMVLAHNPGIGELAEGLTGQWLPQGMKTATVAVIAVNVEWVCVEDGKLVTVIYARDIPDD